MTGASNDSPPTTSKGTTKRWFSQSREDRGTAAVLGSAATILGFAVGLLTGASGPDSAVLAAVLPAVLSTVGGAAAYIATRGDGGTRRMRGIGWLIILFSIALLFGSHVGAVRLDFQKQTAWIVAQKHARARHIEELGICTTLEIQVNYQRKVAGLPPLAFSQVCPFLDDPQPARQNASR